MSQPRVLHCGRFELSLARPLVMGVVNVTPDSFSDGGRYLDPDSAISHARRLLAEGADLLDIGAESTRPGAAPLTAGEELGRLLPVLKAIKLLSVPISVDTRRAEVMAAVLDEGADMINDVAGFRDPQAVRAVASSGAALCVMHMQGEPSTMQQAPVYRDVVSEVSEFLYLQAENLVSSGVLPSRIVLDPGVGFGKTQDQNIELIRAVKHLDQSRWPVLIGLSRKSLIGHLTGRSVSERGAGSLGGAVAAAINGAKILRVHDVAQTRDALTVALRLLNPMLQS
jgi:dihydropteroate synthase